MKYLNEIRTVAFVGDYFPRKCGIATFTQDLFRGICEQYPGVESCVVPVDDIEGGYDYPGEVRFQIAEQDFDSYLRAADFLNFSNADIVSLQHEYGIYGGVSGSHVLGLLRDLRMPVVTTLHTVLAKPNLDQRRVTEQLADVSARLIVMTEKGKALLQSVYGIAEGKIAVIAHGIPDMPFVDPNFLKDKFGVAGKHVALTFGLLAPNKGIEYALRAIPAVLREFPNFVYIVLGATHPNLLRAKGEAYRLSLERLAGDLGIKRSVIFYNRFVELRELSEFLGASDLYLTPYLNPEQITSGTLAYAFGCGKAVISTPYWHAEELLADGRGVLVPFADSDAIAREIIALLADETRRHAMRKQAYKLGREMTWSNVAHLYMDTFQRARFSLVDTPGRRYIVPTLEERSLELPALRLDHLLNMTDSTGIFQHANITIPNFEHGYCTDDNVRALILTVLLEELGNESRRVLQVATTYAAFVNAAYDEQAGRFRNFMTLDRRWIDEPGSDDCFGRALWALGTCVGRSRRADFQYWSVEIFNRALPSIVEVSSPRALAFALLGIHEYFRRLSGDRRVDQVREALVARLMDLYDRTATNDWPWFEEVVSYDNARLSQAMIVSGDDAGNERVRSIGLKTLKWLLEIQRSQHGHLRPVGSNGFYPRGGKCAQFDQQPVEAQATVSACIAASNVTGDPAWLVEARLAFDWFLGHNDLGLDVYDAGTGGCRDGLHPDRVNQNQGAESTLAFQIALAELQLTDRELTVFPPIGSATPVNRGSSTVCTNPGGWGRTE
jgi:glycosyltransferase involved in cell wall biosynthesis